MAIERASGPSYGLSEKQLASIIQQERQQGGMLSGESGERSTARLDPTL